MIKKLFLLMILGLAVLLTVPSTRPRIVDPIRNRLYEELVPQRLGTIAGQLQQRLRRGEGVPDNLERWIESNTSNPGRDPWGTVYFVDQRRDVLVLGSAGADRRRGTADDITVERALR